MKQTKPLMTILRGCSGSGKSSYVRKNVHSALYVVPGNSWGEFRYFRGGRGPSTFVEVFAVTKDLLSLYTLVCSMDHYFMDWTHSDTTGEYRFDPTLIMNAVAFCQSAVAFCLSAGCGVIVDNTHMRRVEFSHVKFMAEKIFGYDVEERSFHSSLFTAEELAARNTHGVPVQRIQQMLDSWED